MCPAQKSINGKRISGIRDAHSTIAVSHGFAIPDLKYIEVKADSSKAVLERQSG